MLHLAAYRDTCMQMKMMQEKDSILPSESTVANDACGTAEVASTRRLEITDTMEQANGDDEDTRSACEGTSQTDRTVKNPSPPPEIIRAGLLEAGDIINGTAVTERWILQILMNLAKAVGTAIEAQLSTEISVGVAVLELDCDLESDLCLLWDSTVEKEVVIFLLKLPTVDIFIDALSCVWIPRLTEIIAGVTANMASVGEACDSLSSNERFCRSLLTALDSNDPPTLGGLFHVFLTFLKNESSSRDIWLRHIESDENLLSRLTFISQSSTNGPLLKAMAKFTDYVLEISDSCCSSWATDDFVSALLEAAQEHLHNDWKHAGIYYHILDCLSTSECGREAIGGQLNKVVPSICSYLHLALDENVIDGATHLIGLSSAMSLIHLLHTRNPNETLDSLTDGGAVESLRNLLKWLSSDRTIERMNFEEQYTVLEDSVCALAERILSSSKGVAFFFGKPYLCKSNMESLDSLVTLSHGKTFICHLYSGICLSQTTENC